MDDTFKNTRIFRILLFIAGIFTGLGILMHYELINHSIISFGELLLGKQLNILETSFWNLRLKRFGSSFFNFNFAMIFYLIALPSIMKYGYGFCFSAEYLVSSRSEPHNPIISNLKKIFLNNYSYLLLFIILYFLLRLPFYPARMVGEDGMFADIFLNHPEGPNYLQIARIDGKEIYITANHPGLIYEILALSGYLFKIFISFETLSDFETTFLLRFAYSFFQLIIWILFIIILTKAHNNQLKDNLILFRLGILILSFSSIAINNSVNIQTDGSVGVLLSGLFALVLLTYYYQVITGHLLYFITFLVTILLGFGKNEWSFLFILTLISGTLYLFIASKIIRKSDTDCREHYIFLAVALAGCIIGNIINYYFDPKNYTGGLNLMLESSTRISIIGTTGLKRWVYITIATAVAFVIIYSFELKAKQKIILVAMYGMIFFNSVFEISYKVRTSLSENKNKTETHQKEYRCIPIMGVADAYNKDNMDYVSYSITYEHSMELVSKYGKVLCENNQHTE